jgi:hypothetical protein
LIFKTNKLKNITILINSIFLIIIIIFTPLAYYGFNLNFYNNLYENNGVFSVLDRDDVLNLTRNLFNFFRYRATPENNISKSSVRYADKSISSVAFFKPEEINHLNDVRKLLCKIFILYYLSIITVILLTILLIKKDVFKFIKSIGYIFTASSSAVLFIMAALFVFGKKNFWGLFENFHLMFFPQGNYIFSQDSLIITLFPFGFFGDFFIKLVKCSLALSIAVLILGIICLNISKIKREVFCGGHH